jgi:hypothetical protein
VQASMPTATLSVLPFSISFPGLEPGPPPSNTPAAMINATAQQLRKAADLQEKIQSLQEQLGHLLGAPVQPATRAPRKRRLSAQGLANIWAGVRKRMAAKTKPARHSKEDSVQREEPDWRRWPKPDGPRASGRAGAGCNSSSCR